MSLVHQVASLKVDNKAVERLRAAEDKLKAGQDAHHEKLSALIQLDRFAAAAKSLDGLTDRFPAEAAYIYYQLGDLQRLRALAASHVQLPAVQLALGQAEYRAGHYDAAAAALASARVSEDEAVDLKVNQNAISAQMGVTDRAGFDIPAFERYFNAAYAYLVRSEPARALEELRSAKAEAGEDEAADVVQQAAYANIVAGDLRKARELLAPLDDPLAAINRLVCDPPADLDGAAAALKLFDNLPTNLVASQQRVLAGNKLRLQARVGLPVAGKAAKHLATYGSDATPTILAKAALTPHELRQKLARDPADVGAAFVLAQQAVAAGRLADAAHLLFQLGQAMLKANANFSPGVLGAIAAAYKHLRRDPTAMVKQVFANGNLAGDYAGAAAILAESNDADAIELADVYFASLNDASLEAQAGKCAVSPATASVAALPSVETLTRGIDAEALDAKGLFALAPHTRVALHSAPRGHRSGKRRLPAAYDEAKQPDPERWLAKQDRSGYKPKKKRGAAQGAMQGATQGATTPAPAVGQVAGGGASGASKKKKKNKKK